MATQLAFEKFRPTKLQVPPSRLQSAKGFPFELNWGEEWYRSWDYLQKDSSLYDTNKYTKVCGGGGYIINESR